MDPEVKDKDAGIQVYGVYVYPLPFTPDKEERKEMSEEAKREFYAMPKDVQDWYRKFKPALGEPEVDTRKPEDEQLWFSKPPFVAVPNEKPWSPPYGSVDFGPKSHLDYHDPSSGISKEEYEAWQDHLESLPPEKQRLIKSFIDPPTDIGQPGQGINYTGEHRRNQKRKKTEDYGDEGDDDGDSDDYGDGDGDGDGDDYDDDDGDDDDGLY